MQLADKLVPDVNEHRLVVLPREPLPGRPPVLHHLDGPVRRLHVVEAGVERVVQRRARRLEVVGRAAHVGVHGEVPERVAKPYHVAVLQTSQCSHK